MEDWQENLENVKTLIEKMAEILYMTLVCVFIATLIIGFPVVTYWFIERIAGGTSC